MSGWHIRDKQWPMRKNGSMLLYVHRNHKAHYDGEPRTATSTFTQLLNSEPEKFISVQLCCLMSSDVGRDKLWPMRKHGSMLLYVHKKTIKLVRTDSPGRPPRLSHSSWNMSRKRRLLSLYSATGSSPALLTNGWIIHFLKGQQQLNGGGGSAGRYSRNLVRISTGLQLLLLLPFATEQNERSYLVTVVWLPSNERIKVQAQSDSNQVARIWPFPSCPSSPSPHPLSASKKVKTESYLPPPPKQP